MRINEERLRSRMDAINRIAVTEEGGMMRLALSDADKTARDLLKSWIKEAGMEVRIDDLGTIQGYLPGTDPNSLPIGVGSHMDTQPNGGRYDGLFGVMSGLEAVCTLIDNGITMKSPLVVIDWTNEEGARFVPPMLASGVVAGNFDVNWVYAKEDKNGIKYVDELTRIGYMGSKSNRFEKAKAYIEPHIEQGPILDQEGYEFGIVTGALGITGLDVKIKGETNHAGTTPMRNRKDALMVAAEAMLELRKKTIEYGDPAVITMGIISASPASKNIVPGEVYFSIDMRHDNDEALTRLEQDVREIIQKVCSDNCAESHIERYWRADPVHFDEGIINASEKVANKLKIRAKRIYSGAGHDAVFINRIIPTGMLFVPSIKGMSHCPQEDTKWEDIVTGTEMLTELLIKIDK
ncbi:MAG: Zn-dependent hydrolase [Eubacteriales bacterium]|nr:Zn-dependent hydrolase [Eubacteriales bacterium]